MGLLPALAAGLALLSQAEVASRWKPVFAVEDSPAAFRSDSIEDVEAGGFLAFRTEKGVSVLHLKSGRILAVLPSAHGCRISPGAKYLLVLAQESRVQILRCEDAAIVGQFPVAGRGDFEPAFSADGSLAATPAGLVVKLADGSTLASLSVTTSRASFSPDGKWLALDEHLFDTSTWKPAKSLGAGEWGPAWKEAFDAYAANLERMAAGTEKRSPDEARMMREAAGLARGGKLKTQMNVRAASFLSDGSYVLSALLSPEDRGGNRFLYSMALTGIFEPGTWKLRSTVPQSGSGIDGSMLLSERRPPPGPSFSGPPPITGFEAIDLPSGKALGLMPVGEGYSMVRRLRFKGPFLAVQASRLTQSRDSRAAVLYSTEALPAAAGAPARARALIESHETLKRQAAAANPAPDPILAALSDAAKQEKTWLLLVARDLKTALMSAIRFERTDTLGGLTLAARIEEVDPASGAELRSAYLEDFVAEAPKAPLPSFVAAEPFLALLSPGQMEKVRAAVSASVVAQPRWKEEFLQVPRPLLLPPAQEHVGKLISQALEEAMKAGAIDRAAALLAGAKAFNPDLFAAQVAGVNASLDQKIKDAGTQADKLAVAAQAVAKLEAAGIPVQGKAALLRQTCEMHLARGDVETARKGALELKPLDPAASAAILGRIDKMGQVGGLLKGAYAAIEKGTYAEALTVAAALEKDDKVRSTALRRRVAALESFKKAGGDEGLKAIAAATGWLARHHAKEAAWNPEPACECMGKKPTLQLPEYSASLAGLAVGAMAYAGHAPFSTEKLGDRTAGDVVQSGVKFLLDAQDPATGKIGGGGMKGHVYATWGLVEAYRAGADIRPRLELAVKHLVDGRNAKAGWRYSYRSGDTDAHITGVAGIALARARDAGLEVPKELFSEVEKWFDQATREIQPPAAAGAPKAKPRKVVGYAHAGDAGTKVFIPGVNENFPWTPAMTALGLSFKSLAGRKDAALTATLAAAPVELGANKADFFYALWGSYAMSLQGTSESKDWMKKAKDPLLQSQVKNGCAAGSWDPVSRWASIGGRLCETAMATLALELLLGAK